MKELRLCDDGKFEDVVELCLKYNLGIELQSFVDPYIIGRNNGIINNHKERLGEINAGKSLHAPFWDLNIGSKINGIRNTTMDMFNFAYDTAAVLGCSGIVVHNGYIPGTYFMDSWADRAADVWNRLLEGKSDEITYYIENQFELSGELLKNVVDKVDDSRLKICLDAGHVNAHSNQSVNEWAELLGDRIGYVHIHNNNGENDEHLGLNNGTLIMLEIIETLEKIAPNAILNIESNIDEMEDSIDFLIRNGAI